ncbi:MAG: arabinogalactan oligomer / maltooligosaccharide transport system substrate-binding protein [Acidobacteriota bacterium]|nr:arabinogalactan oligomer / maltooligosaccharide transport system substrate-binding protein [Acidobacteriota bacterium]
MKKIILAAALLLTLPLAAQSDLVVWHAYRGGEKAAFEKVVANYNASQKKVKVSALAVPYDAFADKITAAVPRGKGPDVFIYAQDRLGGWVAAGKTIEPIDFYLDKATTARFLPSTMQAMTYRKTTYGLPLNYKVMTMIYNKALVKTPPKTTGELVKLAKSLTNAKAGRFGLVYWYSNWYYHAPLFNGFGGGVFDAAGKPIVNSSGNVKSLDLLLKWANKDKILPAEPSTALITSLFNEGNAAIVFSGPWFLEEVSPKVQWGLALLPTIDEAGGKPMKPWMTVEGVYISAPSKNKDAAYEFAKYLTDVPSSKILALEGSQSPANKNVYSDPQVAANPVLKAFRAQVDHAVPMPNVPEMTMMWSPVTTAMNAIVQNASTPKAALDKAQKDVVDTIAKLKK